MTARKPKADTKAGAPAPAVPAAPLAVVPDLVAGAVTAITPPAPKAPKAKVEPGTKRVVNIEEASPLKPDAEITFLEQRIATDQARVHQLQNPIIEYPKWVKSKKGEDRVFETKAAHDNAGPDWAEGK